MQKLFRTVVNCGCADSSVLENNFNIIGCCRKLVKNKILFFVPCNFHVCYMYFLKVKC